MWRLRGWSYRLSASPRAHADTALIIQTSARQQKEIEAKFFFIFSGSQSAVYLPRSSSVGPHLPGILQTLIYHTFDNSFLFSAVGHSTTFPECFCCTYHRCKKTTTHGYLCKQMQVPEQNTVWPDAAAEWEVASSHVCWSVFKQELLICSVSAESMSQMPLNMQSYQSVSEIIVIPLSAHLSPRGGRK